MTITTAATVTDTTERRAEARETVVSRCRCSRINASLHGKQFGPLTIRSQNRTVCLCLALLFEGRALP